ncbi:hypothetical protein D3C72_2031950 [compost metagenome]
MLARLAGLLGQRLPLGPPRTLHRNGPPAQLRRACIRQIKLQHLPRLHDGHALRVELYLTASQQLTVGRYLLLLVQPRCLQCSQRALALSDHCFSDRLRFGGHAAV